MSFEDGWAALHLEMPKRVPRTEYSADGHWELVRAVTGIDVGSDSPPEVRKMASNAFMRAWNYDLVWHTMIGKAEFGQKVTNMGHAVYAAGGVDFVDNRRQLFADPEEALRFDLWEAYGPKDRSELIHRFETNYRNRSQSNPESVNMTGIYITLVSGFIDIFGWDMLLLAAGTDARRCGELFDRYSTWIQQYFDALAAADVPVVMIHDDMVWTEGAIFRPDWYRKYVFPNYKRQFAPLRQAGKIILWTSDGNYTEFIDDIADCGVSGFVMEPTTDMAYVAEKYGRTHSFIGNADTRILLLGTKAQIRAEVERCMAIGKNCPGFFLAVGNHIPANTPVENALYYNQVYEELSRR